MDAGTAFAGAVCYAMLCTLHGARMEIVRVESDSTTGGRETDFCFGFLPGGQMGGGGREGGGKGVGGLWKLLYTT
jgi:hypothetical protein